MWLSFWQRRDRFSLEELRYLTDQLKKVQIVSDINKDFVIEALRSIAELVTYGDQHDPTFFEFFMENQVMGEFVRILKISRTMSVALQLLQTMSIMIQNLKSEHAIYYIFSNEHINYLITHSFDFRNEELLSYYMSFLRAISGKLNKNTISLLVKTQNDDVISFPLYSEAIKFAFHGESMIRIAVRALTLNVYHVGDECVNKYVTESPLADYFSDLVRYFRKKCINLDQGVSEASRKPSPESTSYILAAVDEIEDYLYYFSDVISAGIPNLGRLITDSMLQILIFPLLLPSLRTKPTNETLIGATTALYLLCCILRILKTKDLANIIAAAFFFSPDDFNTKSETKLNGTISDCDCTCENTQPDGDVLCAKAEIENLRIDLTKLSSSSQVHPEEDPSLPHYLDGSHSALRVALNRDDNSICAPKENSQRRVKSLKSDYEGETRLNRARLLYWNSGYPYLILRFLSNREEMLSCIVYGDDIQVLSSLTVLATLLQTKELDESMLDALGILPRRKQHKKLLLQALVGEGLGEEQLFSSENSLMRDGIVSELDGYLRSLEDQYGLSCSCREVGVSPRVYRFQVLDALVSLFCRSNISAETLWDGGWLLRQLLPYSEAEFNTHHLKLLKSSFKNHADVLLQEVNGTWPDLLITVLTDEWKKCKRAIEASCPLKDPKCILLPPQKSSSDGETSFSAGERMLEIVKVFVLCHQLQIFSMGGALPDQPPLYIPSEVPLNPRAKAAGLDVSGPKPGSEINLADAVPCRIAFERGKERHFCFLALCKETSGWVLLAEGLPNKQHYGVVRVAAPLSGSNPKIDDKHSKWLHLRIRPSTLPFMDASGKPKTKSLIDGRWTLSFRDEETCKSALSMILEEMVLQNNEIERRLKPMLDFNNRLVDTDVDPSISTTHLS
ncbi:hypothetical protein GIB67_034745 [Kingdonia uniflora]|uniref:FPL domain-containing protein n=1 Tax=Kingdonia uniflora TaxID=39325 RepID=A0A7J7MLK5_9MAGN|nr:hypothetical protein GIB67_034745 [Kingdonia uniflora]